MPQGNSPCTCSLAVVKLYFLCQGNIHNLGKELTQGGGCLSAPWEGTCLSQYTLALCGSPVKCWIGS